MKKTLIAVALAAFVSTGAFAAKPIKPGPAPDLTPRVEALETAVSDLNSEVATLTSTVSSLETSGQQQATRIQDLEDALGVLQPTGGYSPVIVDANDRVIGVPYDTNEGTLSGYQNILVKPDGFDRAYRVWLKDSNQEIAATDEMVYSDSTCGTSGGQAYLRYSIRMEARVGRDMSGNWFAPMENIAPENIQIGSRGTYGRSCFTTYVGPTDVVSAVQFDFDFTFPFRLEFR